MPRRLVRFKSGEVPGSEIHNPPRELANWEADQRREVALAAGTGQLSLGSNYLK